MESIKIFLIIFIFFTVTIASDQEDNCLPSRCSNSPEITVQFPFSLEGTQQERCRYPGFNMSCDQTNRAVVELGVSGKFSVRRINYITQEVEIYDQDNCLPKRLLDLNLSGSPFDSYYSQDVIFFNCSSDYSTNRFLPIPCLSTSKHSVFAAYAFMRPWACDILGSVSLPISQRYSIPEFGFMYDYLLLPWDTPSCGDCAAQGGDCRFKKGKGNRIGCFNSPRRGLSKGVKLMLGFGLGIPGFMCAFLLGCFVYGRLKTYNAINHQHRRHVEASSIVLPQPSIFVVGLDESVIQSYPKTVLGESRQLANPDDNICAICLSEYKPKEILKTIPDCEHCFHAACIDEWLRRNVTCPLCRNSPQPLPIPT
ncbi:hypothetical protein ACHQM5_012018 [Ranunculus cassubicifolius]